MKILMTGGTGLLGQSIGRALVRSGHSVHVHSRSSAANLRPKMSYPVARFYQSLESVPWSELDAVIHLAGEPVAGERWSKDRKDRIMRSRVEGTSAIVQALKAAKNVGPLKAHFQFVSASAIGFYGDRSDQRLNAGSDPGDGFLADVVKAWEAEALKAQELEVAVTRVRLGIVLSSEGGALTEMMGPFLAGVGGALGSGRQWMSWIHIDDATQIFCDVATGALTVPGGVIEAVAPNPVPNLEFTQSLCKALGVSQFASVPAFALYARFGEMAQILLASQRVYPDALSSTGFQFQHESLTSALNEILQGCEGGRSLRVDRQFVPKPIDEVWEFFASEKNLETLTPAFLNFKILRKSTAELTKGTEIDYKLQLNGVPFHWTTLITEWTPKQSFADQQLKGPYRFWEHSHRFESLGGGTLVTDRVTYKVPLGTLGLIAGGWKVESDLEKIFAFRREKVDELFHRGS